MDESREMQSDLAQISRLALGDNDADVRLYISRLVRRYRDSHPDLAQDLASILRRSSAARPSRVAAEAPAADRGHGEASLSILRFMEPLNTIDAPVLADELQGQLDRMLRERAHVEDLARHGLTPASSAVFVGPPGVGKTRTARWLAAELVLPMYSLDLTAVMSSRLGQSGANLRYALDRAKAEPSVLFLDEIDAIAKRRDDGGDVGELKRLVTILLQEIDEWPSTSVLLAATNHPDLVDPALWRRFDVRVTFAVPSGDELDTAIRRFLGDDEVLLPYVSVFRAVYEGSSYSEIERSLQTMRKWRILADGHTEDVVAEVLAPTLKELPHKKRADLAVELYASRLLTQRRVRELTGISRDTIRKRAGALA